MIHTILLWYHLKTLNQYYIPQNILVFFSALSVLFIFRKLKTRHHAFNICYRYVHLTYTYMHHLSLSLPKTQTHTRDVWLYPPSLNKILFLREWIQIPLYPQHFCINNIEIHLNNKYIFTIIHFMIFVLLSSQVCLSIPDSILVSNVSRGIRDY